jgi:hypothetical protein
LLLFVTKRCGFLKILRFDGAFFFYADFFYLLLDVLHIGWPSHGIDAGTRAGLVHDVDRLVGKKSSSDITIGKSDSRFQRLVGESRFVMSLVLRAQAFEDLNSFVDRRRIYLDRLKATFQRCVFLDILAVFVHRRRAHALQFTAAQRGLDDVRSVHRAFCGTSPDDCVQLVDEEDHVFGTTNLIHHSLDAFFKLATVFCACHH